MCERSVILAMRANPIGLVITALALLMLVWPLVSVVLARVRGGTREVAA